MNEVEQQAYAARVERATSDPSTAANMTRQLAAIESMVCGRPGHLADPAEPVFMAGMRLTPGELDVLLCAAAKDGRDAVYVHFDVDDPSEPTGIAVISVLGDTVRLHPACRLWSPAGGGRAVIVPVDEDAEGQFSFRTGQPLRHAANRPADALDGGFRRASSRVSRLVESGAAEQSVRLARRCITTSKGGGRLTISLEPIAA